MISLVLTPAQLAAMMVGATLDRRADWRTRAWGGAKLLFGGLEELTAVGLLLAPEPTMATKVGGGALAAHGADTIQSGARQLWTGRETTTLTSDGSAALAGLLGVNAGDARRIGEGIDMAVPLALSLGLGALRVVAVRNGRFLLASHEARVIPGPGGHTLLRHVGLTDDELARRLATSKLPQVSTFTNLREAERVVAHVLRTNHIRIADWARGASNANLRLNAPIQNIGRVLERGATSTRVGRGVRVVLKRQAYRGKLYYVLTAFPE